eukprot:jgi/Bigna1/84782/estExt_fgenesh1_pg.C_10050
MQGSSKDEEEPHGREEKSLVDNGDASWGGEFKSKPRLRRKKTHSQIHYEHNKRFVSCSVLIIGMASFIRGCDLGLLPSVLVPMQREFSLNMWQLQMLVSGAMISAAFGSLLCGAITDSIGPRNTLVSGLEVICFGMLIMVIADERKTMPLMIGRIVIGVGFGITRVVSPTFIGEISSRAQRKGLIEINSILALLGPCIGFAYSFIFKQDWRWCIVSLGTLSGVWSVVTVWLLPRSPRWLLAKGRTSEAEEVIRSVVQEPNHVRKNVVVKSLIAMMKYESKSWGSTIYDENNSSKIQKTVGISLINQLTGIEAVLYYSIITLTRVGVAEQSSLYVGLAMVNSLLLGTMFSVIAADCLGIARRFSMCIGSCGVFATCLAIACLSEQGWLDQYNASAFFILYSLCFGLAYGALDCTFIFANFGSSYRLKSLALNTFCNRLGAFLVSVSYLYSIRQVGLGGTYLLFFGMAVVGFIFFPSSAVETKSIT